MKKSPFDLGLTAAESGGDEVINPFPVSSDEWSDWYYGFKCVCIADAQARRDLQRFFLTPSVGIFTCALAAMIDIMITSNWLGLSRLFAEGFMPWGGVISAVLISTAVALAARLKIWIDVIYIAAILVPVPFVPRFDPSIIQHEWCRYVIGSAFILAPLLALVMLVREMKYRYRALARCAAQQARTTGHEMQR
jgi:hypothetical protein